jgi:sulfide:quinone oxidoreductase
MVTKDGDELPYDRLVLAVGAQPDSEWHSQGVRSITAVATAPTTGCWCASSARARVDQVAFVKPARASWPLPLYDLALLTAAECAAHDRADVELSLITPERGAARDLR